MALEQILYRVPVKELFVIWALIGATTSLFGYDDTMKHYLKQHSMM